MHKLWLLAVSFAIIGVGAYGGGLVTVPLMNHELVKSRHLLQSDEMSEVVAIAQMTPGPIAVNAATFVGFQVMGIGGALLATTIVVLPAILVLIPVGYLRETMEPNYHFVRLRRGLRAAVLSLLVFAIWSYGNLVVTGSWEFGIALGAFVVLTMFEGKVHPLAVIGAGGVIGLLIF
ncbi:MAG: chromate transporter [Candidatus Brocadiia bacterium]